MLTISGLPQNTLWTTSDADVPDTDVGHKREITKNPRIYGENENLKMTNKERDAVISFIGTEGKTFIEVQRKFGNNEAADLLRELTSTASTPYPLVTKTGRDFYELSDAGIDWLSDIEEENSTAARLERAEKREKINTRLSVTAIIIAVLSLLRDVLIG